MEKADLDDADEEHFVKINQILNKQYLSRDAQKIFEGPVIKSDLRGYVNRDAHSQGSHASALSDRDNLPKTSFKKAFNSFKRTARQVIDLKKCKYNMFGTNESSTQATSKHN